MITFEDIKNNKDVKVYIEKADELLKSIGYTEHSYAHVCKVSDTASYILKSLNVSEKDIELAKIAGYLHDIGNLVNRVDHSQTGAILAFRILDKMGMDPADIATIVMAIGNHDEKTAEPVNAITAALIIADKTDVRRSRVRNNLEKFDIHDRVNYSVTKTNVTINESKTMITLELDVDTKYCSVMDYFEIFLSRMILCKRAANKLNLEFALIINGQRML